MRCGCDWTKGASRILRAARLIAAGISWCPSGGPCCRLVAVQQHSKTTTVQLRSPYITLQLLCMKSVMVTESWIFSVRNMLYWLKDFGAPESSFDRTQLLIPQSLTQLLVSLTKILKVPLQARVVLLNDHLFGNILDPRRQFGRPHLPHVVPEFPSTKAAELPVSTRT